MACATAVWSLEPGLRGVAFDRKATEGQVAEVSRLCVIQQSGTGAVGNPLGGGGSGSTTYRETYTEWRHRSGAATRRYRTAVCTRAVPGKGAGTSVRSLAGRSVTLEPDPNGAVVRSGAGLSPSDRSLLTATPIDELADLVPHGQKLMGDTWVVPARFFARFGPTTEGTGTCTLARMEKRGGEEMARVTFTGHASGVDSVGVRREVRVDGTMLWSVVQGRPISGTYQAEVTSQFTTIRGADVQEHQGRELTALSLHYKWYRAADVDATVMDANAYRRARQSAKARSSRRD